MNKKILVLLATCVMAATSLPLTGCAASKNQNTKALPAAGTSIVEATMEYAEEPEEAAEKHLAVMKLEGTPSQNLMTSGHPVVSLALALPQSKKDAKKTKKTAKKITKRSGSSKNTVEILTKKEAKEAAEKASKKKAAEMKAAAKKAAKKAAEKKAAKKAAQKRAAEIKAAKKAAKKAAAKKIAEKKAAAKKAAKKAAAKKAAKKYSCCRQEGR